MSLEITHVRKDRDGDITHLKGNGWDDSIAGVISDIENSRYSYHVLVAGQQARVRVVPATLRHKKYLKTDADTTSRNNLDNLPRF